MRLIIVLFLCALSGGCASFDRVMHALANMNIPSNSGSVSSIQPVRAIQNQRNDGHEFIYDNAGNQTGYINHNERERLDGRKNIYNTNGQQTGYTRGY